MPVKKINTIKNVVEKFQEVLVIGVRLTVITFTDHETFFPTIKVLNSVDKLGKNIMKYSLALLKTILLGTAFSMLSFQQNCIAQTSLERAGFRSSIYGFDPFPDSTWFYNVTADMALRFEGSDPAVIWILGYTTDNGCYLGFPNPTPDSTYESIFFSGNDTHEAYLNDFDSNGIKVWLQVEPGFADIETLIDLVLTQYGHHQCVVGFGVDVEWYKIDSGNDYEGEAVTDMEAQTWSTKIKSYNEDYLLFTKHWLISKMPPTFREDVVFVDNSQIFSNMNSLINEFEDWANAFTPAKVAFQYGYNSDKIWWQDLNDPPKSIGDAILQKCPNTTDLFWMDFTAYDIWPEDFEPTSIPDQEMFNKPNGFRLYQNYPNPFNPETTITYLISQKSQITIDIFDLQGRHIKNVYNGISNPGEYTIKVNLDGFGSGIYFYVLFAENSIIQIRKMTLLK